MAKINNELRNKVFAKYDYQCAYCGSILMKGWQVDHIKPKILGATMRKINKLMECENVSAN